MDLSGFIRVASPLRALGVIVSRDGADVKYGQFTILLRDKNAVVTVTAESRQADQLLQAVFDEIYPQL